MYTNREFVMMPEFAQFAETGDKEMSVYKSIMQGLNEAVKYQEGTLDARKTKISIKPVESFSSEDIKQIRNHVGLSQALFASLLGISKKNSRSLGVWTKYPIWSLPPISSIDQR